MKKRKYTDEEVSINIKKKCKYCGKVMPRTKNQRETRDGRTYYAIRKKFCNITCSNAYNKAKYYSK